jgi:hypothetical protein
MNNKIKSLINFLRSSGFNDIATEIRKLAQDVSSKVFYHVSPNLFGSFDPNKSQFGGLTYFTENKNFAQKAFSSLINDGEGISYLYTIKIKQPLNLFEPNHPENINKLRPLVETLVKEKYKDPVTGVRFDPTGVTIMLNGEEIKDPSIDQMTDWMLWRISNKSWRILEGGAIIKFIKESGYDGVLTNEIGSDNVGIFDTSLIDIVKIEEVEDKKIVREISKP